ncbi:MAG: hypothetical protein RLZZ546_1594 [Bacteroidota bacterium]|jgi:hypothetical protein
MEKDLFDSKLKLVKIGYSRHSIAENETDTRPTFVKKHKWLAYFYEQFDPHISFLEALQNQLPAQFENLKGKKIDWKKVWLYTQPTDNPDPLSLFYEEEEFIYNLFCSISNTFNSHGVYLNFRWSANLIDFKKNYLG